jgi:hypothetical protein
MAIFNSYVSLPEGNHPGELTPKFRWCTDAEASPPLEGAVPLTKQGGLRFRMATNQSQLHTITGLRSQMLPGPYFLGHETNVIMTLS